MKVHILACFHGRQNVSKVFLAGVERLQKDFDISYTFVASDESDIAFNDGLGFKTHTFQNNPVSDKFNYGLSVAMQSEWDYLMIMGSDDLISSEGVSHLLDNSYNYKGFGRIVFYNAIKKESILYEYSLPRLIGCGRMISRDAIEMIMNRSGCRFRKHHNIGKIGMNSTTVFNTSRGAGKYLEGIKYGKVVSSYNNTLWASGLNSGLDNSSELNLAYHGFYSHKLDRDVVDMVDIKTCENITEWDGLVGLSKPTSFDFWFLSQKEKDLLKELSDSLS